MDVKDILFSESKEGTDDTYKESYRRLN